MCSSKLMKEEDVQRGRDRGGVLARTGDVSSEKGTKGDRIDHVKGQGVGFVCATNETTISRKATSDKQTVSL